jgi:hypothetical protein
MKKSPGGRLRGWRARRCSSHASARQSQHRIACGQAGAGDVSAPDTGDGQANVRETSASRAAAGESVAAAMQSAIGLLTASLDSPALMARALPALIPEDADGLADLMAGLHLISELLILELDEATGEPPQAVLQRLAMVAEHQRGKPSAG